MARALTGAELVKRYGPRVYALARRLTGRQADADDLVQEVFLRAVRGLSTFEGRSDPGTWLYRITVRAWRRQQGRGRRSDRRPLPAAMPMGDVADARSVEGPGSVAVRAEALRALESGIAALPASYRVPLVLSEIAELPQDQVAGVLGLRPATVRTRVHRARMLLRRGLDRAMPTVSPPPPAYGPRVCLDLLTAKQLAMDEGRAFDADAVLCERCRVVFASMDLQADLCRGMVPRALPQALATRVLAALREFRSPVRRGRPRGPRTRKE